MPRPLRVLLLEDNPADAELVLHELRRAGLEPQWERVQTEPDFLACLDRPPEVILADYQMPEFDAPRALRLLHQRGSDIPFIVVSGTIGEDVAVNSMKGGATDFLLKDRLARLGVAVTRALEAKQLREDNRRAVEALRQSEARFRGLIENCKDSIAVLQADGTILYESPSIEAILGYKPEELVGRSAFEPLHPDDLARVQELFAAGLRQPGVFSTAEVRYRHKNGSWRILEATGSNQLETPGVAGIVINVHDITERRQAEEAVRAERNLLRAVIDNVPDLILTKDTQGRFGLSNTAHLRLLGLTEESQAAGKTAYDFFDRSLADGYWKDDLRVVQTGEAVLSREESVQETTGALRQVLTTKVPLRDAGGKVTGIVCIVRDITERRSAELALQESEARYRRLVEDSPDMIFIGCDLKIVYINRAGLRLLGATSPDQVVGRPVLDFVHPDSREIVTARMAAGPPAPPLPEKYLRLDGSTLEVEVTAVPLVWEGRPGAEVIVHDLTDRKRAAAYDAVFASLSHHLSSARSPKEAAQVISQAADALLGWDVFLLDLVDPGEAGARTVLAMDIIDGQRREVAPMRVACLSPVMRRTLATGAQLILRQEGSQGSDGLIPIGDTNRRSAALMFAPVRQATRTVGVLSIQSYTPKAYDQGKLKLLQALADHCAGALGRIQAEEQLRQLSVAVEQSPMSILITDLRGTIEYVNPRFVELTGYTAAEVIGQNPRFLKSGQTPPETYRQMWASLTAGQAWRGEFCNKKMNGETYWELAVISPVRDEAGVTTHYLAIKEDVTQHKQNLVRLAAFSQLGQRLSATKTARDAARVIVETADHLLGWDACTFDLYAADTDQIHSILNVDLIDGRRTDVPPRRDATSPTARARRVTDSGGFVIRQDESSPPDPEAVFFGDTTRRSASLLYVPVRDGRTVIGILSIQSYQPRAYDAVALQLLQSLADFCAGALSRVQAQEALQESEKRFRLITETIQEVFWLADVETQHVNYVSPAYEQIWGRSRASVYDNPRSFFEAVLPEDQAAVQHQLDLKPTGRAFALEYRIQRPDGSIRWILDRGFPVPDTDGHVTRFVGLAQDITEKKALEAQLLRAQRLESIGTLASGVAHDLNNILAPIQMATQLLREERDEGERQKILSTIDASAQRGAAIVKQVLTFARGVEGERVLLQPRHLVREVLKIAQETFPKNLTLTFKNPKDLWAVTGDATQLHQVLLNLCVNARDAMPNGGTLSVRAENLAADESFVAMTPEAKVGQYVVLQVADTGTGIPAGVIDRIFDPFFTTKPVGKGTGLGLSTVLGIVKSHGGFITVSSQVDRGTTFKIFLPATATQPPSAARTATALERRGQGELVLVADDESAIRDVTVRMLEHSGYTCLSAADGTEALALYSQHRLEVKVLVTDILMPEMDGPALVRILRRMAPDLPIIASTGMGQSDKVEELRALGVKWFLPKPYTSAKLLAALQQALAAPTARAEPAANP